MMIPEKVFEKILVLGEGWRVQQVDYVEKESQVLIRIEDTPALWAAEACPHCGRRTVGGYDHAPERRWRHLNVCQLQSEIVCALPRGRCRECEKVYTVRAPWEGRSRGLTQEFEAFALTLMREMPVSKAGEILGDPAANERKYQQLLERILELAVDTARLSSAPADLRVVADYARVLIAARRESHEALRAGTAREKFEFDAATACLIHQTKVQAIAG